MVRKLWAAFIALLLASLAAQPLVAWHPHFAAEAIFGFNAVYGYLACAALIVIAKAIGLLLKRPERYYDDD